MVARLVSNIQHRQRNLQRLRTRNLAFAMKSISDRAAVELVYELRQQAQKDFNIRRKSFPSFRIVKAAAGQDRLTRTAKVTNAAGLNDILRLQLSGGIRRPQKKRRLLVRSDMSKWGRKFTAGQRAKQYRGRTKRGRLVVYQYFRRQGPRIVASLPKSARIKKRYDIFAAVRATRKKLPQLGAFYLRLEVAGWERRLTRGRMQ